MKSIKYVPADADARRNFPTRVLIVKVCANPRNGDANNKRRMTGPESDREARKNGWIRLSELSRRERAHWKSVYTIMGKPKKENITREP